MKNIEVPEAEKQPYKMTIHGDTRIDDYYWMRLSDKQKNAKEFDSQTNKLLDVASERFNKKSFSELLRESPSELDEAEMETVLDLFNNIFTYDLRKRCAADEILQHKWLSFIG